MAEVPTMASSSIYPANLVLEGHDQHSRWFLCSLLTSVALQNRAPFMTMKTHGLLLDDTENKMSKSRPAHVIDPSDLILGTQKLDGARSHGFGPDVLRLWVATHDTDKVFGVDIEELKSCNQQVKLFRQLCKQLLGNLFEFQVREQKMEFGDLRRID